MKCTECDKDFTPDCDQEEICPACQAEDVPEAHMIVTDRCAGCGTDFAEFPEMRHAPDYCPGPECTCCQFWSSIQAKAAYSQPDEADFLIYKDGCCCFCGAKLRSRPLFEDCDEAEIYCPDCWYTEGIE